MLRTPALPALPTLRAMSAQFVAATLARTGLDRVPRPLLVSALLITAVWVGSVFWAASTIGSATDDEVQSLVVLGTSEVGRLQAEIDSLGGQLELLQLERVSLRGRIAGLEASALSASVPAPALDAAAAVDVAAAFAAEAAAVPAVAPPPASTVRPAPAAPRSTNPFVAGAALNTGGQDLYNCRDFATWQQAQAVFLASGTADPNRIDMDRDGIACESLR